MTTPRPSAPQRARLLSVAVWSPAAPTWAEAAAALRGGPGRPEAEQVPRPAGALLAANERRRAPETVLMALEVAAAACAAAGVDPRRTPSVFASTHGDLPTTDALCRTLADNPALLSPTRFHHSVHNAASGYWAIAAGATASSTAVSAQEQVFAAGLLEALCLSATEQQPVLLVAYDTEAEGALASVNASRGRLAVGLVVAPQDVPAAAARGATSEAADGIDSVTGALDPVAWTLDWALTARPARPAGAPAAASTAAAESTVTGWPGTVSNNGCGDALPLLRALALGQAATVALPPLLVHLHPQLHNQAPG